MNRDLRIHSIVVDTEGRSMIRFGLAQQLATVMNVEYLAMENLKVDTLCIISRSS